MTGRRRERLRGEVVVRPVPEAQPVPVRRGELARPVAPPQLHITIEQPGMVAPPLEEGWPTWKRLVGFVVTIVGTALLLIALLGPPHIVQSHHRPPDLVHPSR
jgi:hypothetical protein